MTTTTTGDVVGAFRATNRQTFFGHLRWRQRLDSEWCPCHHHCQISEVALEKDKWPTRAKQNMGYFSTGEVAAQEKQGGAVEFENHTGRGTIVVGEILA